MLPTCFLQSPPRFPTYISFSTLCIYTPASQFCTLHSVMQFLKTSHHLENYATANNDNSEMLFETMVTVHESPRPNPSSMAPPFFCNFLPILTPLPFPFFFLSRVLCWLTCGLSESVQCSATAGFMCLGMCGCLTLFYVFVFIFPRLV